jgi:hypothetical protein
MFDRPTTKDAAMKYRYGRWAGRPNGDRYAPARCAEEVSAGAGSWLFCQCTRNAGYGPDDLYCKQHAKRFAASTN